MKGFRVILKDGFDDVQLAQHGGGEQIDSGPLFQQIERMSRLPMWAAAPNAVSQSPLPQSHAALSNPGCCSSIPLTLSKSA